MDHIDCTPAGELMTVVDAFTCVGRPSGEVSRRWRKDREKSDSDTHLGEVPLRDRGRRRAELVHVP